MHPASQTLLDPSLRHVQPERSPAVENLAALWAVDADLARRIEQVFDAPRATVSAARSGMPTLAAPTDDGRTLQLHSRYDPIEEAVKQVDRFEGLSKDVICALGFALGYHLEQLLERSSGDLVIVEPDLNVLTRAVQTRPLEKLLTDPRVTLMWQVERRHFFEKLQRLMPAIYLGHAIFEHPPSVARLPRLFAEARTLLDEHADFCRTSVGTLLLNSRRTAENVSRNLGFYVTSPSLRRLKDSMRGMPAIVVSAGPSLARNMHLLPRAAGKAVIVAAQTAFKPLLGQGVSPDFVTSLDYHDICARFFENIPENCPTELVAEPKATRRIFESHTGPITLCGNEFAQSLLRELRLEHDTLPGSATVAHLSYYLAEYLGCDPIIFVGQDLGFSDGLCYAPGTSYDEVWRPELGRFCSLEQKQWEQIIRDKPILRRATDYKGRPAYTEARLFTYLQQFERDFAASPRRIIDATEGGLLKRGATPMTLADAIGQFCTRQLPPRPMHPGVRLDRLEPARAAIEKRLDETRRIRQIARQTLALLEQVEKALDDPATVTRLIAQIDPLRAQMNELGQTYDLILHCTQPTEIRRFIADRQIRAASLEPGQRQRRQVARDIENVRSIISGSETFEQILADAVTNLRVWASSIGRAA